LVEHGFEDGVVDGPSLFSAGEGVDDDEEAAVGVGLCEGVEGKEEGGRRGGWGKEGEGLVGAGKGGGRGGRAGAGGGGGDGVVVEGQCISSGVLD